MPHGPLSLNRNHLARDIRACLLPLWMKLYLLYYSLHLPPGINNWQDGGHFEYLLHNKGDEVGRHPTFEGKWEVLFRRDMQAKKWNGFSFTVQLDFHLKAAAAIVNGSLLSGSIVGLNAAFTSLPLLTFTFPPTQLVYGGGGGGESEMAFSAGWDSGNWKIKACVWGVEMRILSCVI